MILHEEVSPFQTIRIRERDGLRILECEADGRWTVHGIQDITEPERVVSEWEVNLILGLLPVSEPKSVLILGLGSGRLPALLSRAYPETRQTIVELDPAIVEAARRWFGFLPSPNTTLHIADAGEFLREGCTSAEMDIVFVDIFLGCDPAASLSEPEFFSGCRSCLTRSGWIAVNVHTHTTWVEQTMECVAALFGRCHLFPHPHENHAALLASRGGSLVHCRERTVDVRNRTGVDLSGRVANMVEIRGTGKGL